MPKVLKGHPEQGKCNSPTNGVKEWYISDAWVAVLSHKAPLFEMTVCIKPECHKWAMYI